MESCVTKAQEPLSYGNASTSDYETALQHVNEALTIAKYADSLFYLKAQSLLGLRKYTKVLQLCERTLEKAEMNAPKGSNGGEARVWRLWIEGRTKFCMGKLEDALEIFAKVGKEPEPQLRNGDVSKSKEKEASQALASSIRELLAHKKAGNDAFQASRHVEAVEHYSSALSTSQINESRPFNAVCFCNRAAASQALGLVADAIADCSRAIALDSSYAKAISRRATLHEMVRNYSHAVADLQRLIQLLEKSSSVSLRDKALSNEVSSAKDRLLKAESEVKKGSPVDHYLIMGVSATASAGDIKKAYRKAALRHHPDKAGLFLVRNDPEADGSLWRDVGDEVQREAHVLFNLIGESYAILSDETKRQKYDAEEQSRKMRGGFSNGMYSGGGGGAGAGGGGGGGDSSSFSSMFSRTGRKSRDWDGGSQRWQGRDSSYADPQTRRSRPFYHATSSQRRYGEGGSGYGTYDWDDM